MSQCILKSVRGKRTLYFAGFKNDNPRKPRFAVRTRDAKYLEMGNASTIRDNLSDRNTKVTILRCA